MPPDDLWFDRPAERWVEALALGNGRLGVMVHGGIDVEHLQVNDGTAWSGSPHSEHAAPTVDAATARDALTAARVDLFGDPSEGFAALPGLTVCSLCAGETLGTTELLPGGQMSRLERLEASGVTRLTLVECLDECERGDVVVARPASHHRAAGAPPVWFERLAGDDLTDELAHWLTLGGPGAAFVPLALRELVIRSGERPPSENGLHEGHSMDPSDPEESMTTSPTTMTDPVCGMAVDPDTAAASTELDGETYYFCSKGCLRSFLADPTQYVTP